MLHPLASLWRHPARVTFYNSDSLAGHHSSVSDGLGFSPSMVSRRRFASADEAFHYLRYWLGEPSARSELRWILQRSGSSLACGYGATDGWVHALAGRLATGAIVVLQDSGAAGRPGRLVASGAGAMSAAAFAALPLLSDMASTVPVVSAVSVASSEPVVTAIAVSSTEAPLASSVAEVEAPQVVVQTADVYELGKDEVEVQEADEHEMLVQSAQAETFEQAAVTGTPFCEICARQAAVVANVPAQAETSEPLSPALPSPLAAAQAQAADQVAQAKTLELAAITGAPFCEICEKHRLALQDTNYE